MYFTAAYSKNAVAKKARLRIERAEAVPKIERRKIRVPRSRARFTITVQDHQIGDGMRLSLRELPWRGRFISTEGQELSTKQVCGAIREVLNHP